MHETKTHTHSSSRFIELDILRAIAILLMIAMHIFWDLNYFGIFPLIGGIYQFNTVVPLLFFILIGICLSISMSKQQQKQDTKFYSHLFVRGMWVLSLGFVITIVTYLFMPDRPIIFGVLHCIGLSIIVSIPFLRLKRSNLFIGLGVVGIGWMLSQYSISNPTILHLIIGLHQEGIWMYTIDYFPLFPWFGVSLIGIALGNWLYRDGVRQFHFPDLSCYRPVYLFSLLGRHSLLIYLIHQPIIAAILGLYIIL